MKRSNQVSVISGQVTSTSSSSSSSTNSSPSKRTRMIDGYRQRSSSNQNVDQIDYEAFEKDREQICSEINRRNNEEFEFPDVKLIDHFKTVLEAYQYLHSICKNLPLAQAILPIVWRHHLYGLFSNRTKVDTELETLSRSDEIRILNVGTSSRTNDIIIRLEDFCNYFTRKKNLLIELFLTKVVKANHKTKYSTEELNKCGFGQPAIDKFINLGLLTGTDLDLNIRQLSFPGLGIFIRTLHDGRRSLLATIRKSKYSQIVQSELVKRTIPRCMGKEMLGIELHLYDIYGADLVLREPLQNDVLIRIMS